VITREGCFKEIGRDAIIIINGMELAHEGRVIRILDCGSTGLLSCAEEVVDRCHERTLL
jgi:hypothetical protein